MIEKILKFMEQAGKIAINNQKVLNGSDIYYKDDFVTGIVTKTDKEISDYFATFLKQNFNDISYSVVDEEVKSENGDVFSVFENSEYQFVLDPIDGTLTYANQMPLYAISLGVLHKGKPFLGCIYSPAVDELVYFDGANAHWLKKAFTRHQEDIILNPIKSSSQLIFKNARSIDIKQSNDVKGNLELNLWSCVLHNLYLATNRGKAAFISAMMWDLAGAWAILQHLGYKVYNTKDGKELNRVSNQNFDNNFKFVAPHLICKPEDYDEIISLIKC